MCGIAGFYLKNPGVVGDHGKLEEFVNRLFLGIENRGKHATGFVATTVDGRTILDKNATAASVFVKDREALPAGVRMALLHTRYHTKGSPENHLNNHPVLYKTCFVTHNGHVSNDDDLFAEFNMKRQAEVDSEAIPALLSEFGLDDTMEVMKLLKGPAAIAAINPHENPGELILARGISSPLTVHETDDYIIWSSLKTPIRDAWENTWPKLKPEWNEIEDVKEGTIIRINNGVVSRQTWEVPKQDWSRHSSQTAHAPTSANPTRHPVGFGMGASRALPVSSGSSAAPGRSANVPDRRKETAEWRKNHGWEARALDQRDAPWHDYSDVQGTQRVWRECLACRVTILKQDFRQTLHWGEICLDCYTCLIEMYRAEADKDLREQAIAELDALRKTGKEITTLGPTKDNEEACEGEVCGRSLNEYAAASDPTGLFLMDFELSATDLDQITKYAQTEQQVHLGAVIRAAALLGVDPALVEYVLFRLPTEVIKENDRFYSMYQAFDEAYTEEVDNLWGEYGDASYGVNTWNAFMSKFDSAGEQETPVVEPTPVMVQPKPKMLEGTTWDWCGEHSRAFPRSESCDECDKANAAEDLDAGFQNAVENDDTPAQVYRCEGCARFILNEGVKCEVCQVKDTAEFEFPLCECCARRAVVAYTGGPRADLGWCRRHFNQCNEKKCREKANHVLADGSRVCHTHSRRKSGVRSDTTMIRSGYALIEKQR